MKTLLKILPLFFLPSFLFAKPKKIGLQVIDGVENKEGCWIHLLRPAKPNGTAAIICPGGGYGGLVMGAEGHGIAQWLNSHGITGVVLQYRLPKGRSFVPLEDAQRAILLVRHRAKEWKIDTNKVGIVGSVSYTHLTLPTIYSV